MSEKINHVPLNEKAHGKLKIKPMANYKHAAKEHIIPVVVHEMPLASTEFPIIFVKSEQQDQYIPVALMGVERGENLYCEKDGWDANYRPLALTNTPLSLAVNEAEKQVLVCVDESSALVNEEEGNALFDEKGEQTEYLKKRSEALGDYMQKSQMTRAFVEQLVKDDLLVSRDLTITLGEDKKMNINGLFIIDEEKFDKLPAEQFSLYKDRGVLPAIYGHLASLQQIHRITRLKMQKDQAK